MTIALFFSPPPPLRLTSLFGCFGPLPPSQQLLLLLLMPRFVESSAHTFRFALLRTNRFGVTVVVACCVDNYAPEFKAVR